MKMAVECPGCGADAEVEVGRRSAELFCARCDYPLFWVTPPRSLEDDDTADLVLRRRPGAAGIRLPATLPCPACRELNLVTELVCVRCGSPMHIEPEPEPEPEPVLVAEPAPEPEPEPEPAWWQPWMTAVAIVIAVAVLGILAALWA